jgi:hypothetical protein
MITRFKLYPHTVGKDFPPRQRKSTSLHHKCKVLVSLYKLYKSTSLWHSYSHVRGGLFINSKKVLESRPPPRYKSVLASLYWVICWVSLDLKFDGSILCHFATYVHHLLISITWEEALGPSLKALVECFFAICEWMNGVPSTRKCCSHFAWKCVVPSKSENLFTFSPKFQSSNNDDIVVLCVGWSPRVGSWGHSPMKGPRMKGWIVRTLSILGHIVTTLYIIW